MTDILPQTDKLAIVTGTGGLGYETALVLAQKGAQVVLAGRNPEKGNAAVSKIKGQYPSARVQFESLDLANLKSVADFSKLMLDRNLPVNILVNNAGLMMPPKRQITQDGFELQLGTNYLGHFALTAHLLPLLKKERNARVVNLSSIAHRSGSIHFDDLQWQRSYKPWAAYAQSKLAVLMFSLELQRKSDQNGWNLLSIAAHPGIARTALFKSDTFFSKINVNLVQPWISHSAADGALSTLYAATSPDALAGGYYGPNGLLELKGATTTARISEQAKDRAVAEKLWNISNALTHSNWENI